MKLFTTRNIWFLLIATILFLSCAPAQPVDLGIPKVNPTIAEDIFYFTWAKSRVRLNTPGRDVILSFYAYQYRENTQPLTISVNGNPVTCNTNEGQGRFMWHSTTVPRRYFVDGINEIIFRSNSPATNSWAVCIEYAENPQGSSKSENRGKNWNCPNIGFNYSLVGEYAIRLNDVRGKPIAFEFAQPEKIAEPVVVKSSPVIDLSDGRGGSDFVESITIKTDNTVAAGVLQVRFGATGDIMVQSWTPWRSVAVNEGEAMISPVRLPYFQWQVLSYPEEKIDPGQVMISLEIERSEIADGNFNDFSFAKIFKGEELLNCMRNEHIEMDEKTGGARLRKGEIIRDDKGNALLSNDRTAFNETDPLSKRRWVGERVSDTIWIKKELELNDPAADKAYLMFFYQIWSRASQVGMFDTEEGSPSPLHVNINGQKLDPELYPVKPDRGWRERSEDWRLVEIPADVLKNGINEIILSTDKEGDWRFAYENSLSPNRSARSIDGGKTWDYNHLGENGADNGEYLVRFYLDRYHEKGMVWSMPVGLWGDEKDGRVRRVKDASIQVIPVMNAPPGTEIVTEVRFGADIIPDEIRWTEWSEQPEEQFLNVNVQGNGFKYFQWRIHIRTSSRNITPVLTAVRIQVNGKREVFADERDIVVNSLDNPQLRLSSYPMKFNSFGNEKLKFLRENYPLDELVKGSKDEFEGFLRIANWIRSHRAQHTELGRKFREKYGIDNQVTHWTPNNPIWELGFFTRGYGHLERCYGHFCHDFNQAFIGCCQALGYVARPLIMARMQPPNQSGHSFPEVWSNQHNRWVNIDAYRHQYYVRGDGIPATTMDIHEFQLGPVPFKRIDAIRIDRDLPPEAVFFHDEKQPDVTDNAGGGYNYGCESMGIWPRNNYLDKPFPRPIWDGVLSFRWDDRLWFHDPRVRFLPEFSRYTQRWDDMYFGLNQCFIYPQYRGNGIVQVMVSHNMPRFKCYEVRFDGKDSWIEYSGDFLWKLNPGKNALEIRPVNLYGIPGSSSTLSITMKS